MSDHFVNGEKCPGCHLRVPITGTEYAEVMRLLNGMTANLTDVLVKNGNIRVAIAFQEVHALLRRTPMDGEIFIALKDGVDALARRASEYCLKNPDSTKAK